MSSWQKRFENVSEDKKALMLEMLDEAIKTRDGQSLLEKNEVDELLMVLPDKYFRRLFKLQIENIRRRKRDFIENLKDPDLTVKVFTKLAKEAFENSDDERILEVLDQMDDLRLFHPAVWFKIFKNIGMVNKGWAKSIVGKGTNANFLEP